MLSKFELLGMSASVVCMAAALYLIQVETSLLTGTEKVAQTAQLAESGLVVVGDGEDINKERASALFEASDTRGNLKKLVIDDIMIGTGDAVVAGDTVVVHYIGTLQNGTEFDTHLYTNPAKEQLNTKYSLFTDTSIYYLTWSNSGKALRYQSIVNDLSNVPAKETFYLAEETQVFNGEHSKKYIFQSTDKIYDSRFDRGEGFFSGFEAKRDRSVTGYSGSHKISQKKC